MRARYEIMDLGDNRLDQVCGGNAGDADLDTNESKSMYGLDQEVYVSDLPIPRNNSKCSKMCDIHCKVFENGHWNYYVAYLYYAGFGATKVTKQWVTADNIQR